jgi:hypothetical protein
VTGDFSLLQSIQADSGAHPVSSADARDSVPGDKVAKCEVDHSITLELRLRMSGAMPLVSLYAFMSWTGTVSLLLCVVPGRKLNRDLLNQYVIMSLARSDD